jgi:hypothetical protein
MDAIRTHGLHFAARALLTMVGALLLWSAPASVLGLVVMLFGLICAASGLFAGDFIPHTVDALTDLAQGTPTSRAS